jgi:hypothetical protein
MTVFSHASPTGKVGARIEGRLKDAKMVRESRSAKRANEGVGTGRGLERATPKSRVNWASLTSERDMLVAEVARNLVVVGDTLEAGRDCWIECCVSMLLAVK